MPVLVRDCESERPSVPSTLAPVRTTEGPKNGAAPAMGEAAAAAAARAALASAPAPALAACCDGDSGEDEDQAHPLPLMHRHALHQRDPSMRSMPSLPSSVSSAVGQSAPRLCSSPRGVEKKYLFASPSTRGKVQSEKKKRLQQKRHKPEGYSDEPLRAVTVLSSGRPASQTMEALRDTPAADIMDSLDSTTVAAASAACSAGAQNRRRPSGPRSENAAKGDKGSTLSVYSSPAPASAQSAAVGAAAAAPPRSAAAAAVGQAAAAAAAAAARASAVTGTHSASWQLGLKRKDVAQQQRSDSSALPSHSIGTGAASGRVPPVGSDTLQCALQSGSEPESTGTGPGIPFTGVGPSPPTTLGMPGADPHTVLE